MRHGEPIGGRRYRGQRDDPLSAVGWQQMWDTIADQCPWRTLIASPLLRCRAFAEAVAARHQRPIETDSNLAEMGFGWWEGKTTAEIAAVDPNAIAHFFADPIVHSPTGAEPLESFYQRVARALETLRGRSPTVPCLFITHAGVIRMASANAFDIPLSTVSRITVGYATITRIAYPASGTQHGPPLLSHSGR